MKNQCERTNIEIANEAGMTNEAVLLLKKITADTLSRFNSSDASVSIALVDDQGTQKVNMEFLSSNEFTDVISFNLSDDEQLKEFELIINASCAKRQSEKRQHSLEAELCLYAVHGLLHQLGFDDQDKDSARKMHEMEDVILTEAGFGNVYKKK